MYYVVFKSLEQRNEVVKMLKESNIYAVFHYLSLHKSPYYTDKHDGRELPEADRYTDCLLRLPMYYELDEADILKTVAIITSVLDPQP